jgi:hypothetical protein
LRKLWAAIEPFAAPNAVSRPGGPCVGPLAEEVDRWQKIRNAQIPPVVAFQPMDRNIAAHIVKASDVELKWFAGVAIPDAPEM